MKRAMMIGAAVILAVSGCMTTQQVNPLCHELSYFETPSAPEGRVVPKSIAVVPLKDLRESTTTSTSMVVNCLPLVWYTTGADSHPEVVYNTSVGGIGKTVTAAGTLADAIPQVLADYLHKSGRFASVKFVTAAELKGSHSYDFVLRGKLVDSQLITTRYSYFVGPGALGLYLLGAPMVKYSASLTVDWRLYDAKGAPRGEVMTATTDGPITQYTGLYYGLSRQEKDVPFGLYVDAVRVINRRTAHALTDLLTE